jgi:hypothetical protein
VVIKSKKCRRRKQSRRILKVTPKMVSKARSRQCPLVAFTLLILFIISKLLFNSLTILITTPVNPAIFLLKTKIYLIRRCRIILTHKLTCMLKIINWCRRQLERIRSKIRAKVHFQASRSKWPRHHRTVLSRSYL